MGLVQVATNTVTSATANVTLTGISDDSVYMVTGVGVGVETNIREVNMRITKSGSPQSDSEYDYAYKGLISNAGFTNVSSTNQTFIRWDSDLGTGTSEFSNFIIYLHNFNSSSEYSIVSFEIPTWVTTPQIFGDIGGGIHTQTSASNGISLKWDGTATFSSGEMVLYKVI